MRLGKRYVLYKHVASIAIAMIAVSAILSACDDGSPYFAKSQTDCVAHVSEFVMHKNRRRIPESLMADFERMNKSMAVSACEVIVSECQPHPNGEICRKLVSDYL